MGRRTQFILGILLTSLTIWLFLTPNSTALAFMQRLDNMFYDLELRTQIYTNPHPHLGPIATVDIDDVSLAKVGHWPWPRHTLAELVDRLNAMGVTAIVFDMFFSEKQPNIAETLLSRLTNTSYLNTGCAADVQKSIPLFDEDTILAQSMSNTRVILANSFIYKSDYIENQLNPPLLKLTPIEQQRLDLRSANGYIDNLALLQHAVKGIGFMDVEPDSDGIVRRAKLIVRYKDAIYPSLALQTAVSIFGDTVKLNTRLYHNKLKLEGIRLGNENLPTDEYGQVFIPFVGPQHTFPTYSAIDVLNGTIPKEALLGKFVIVGTSALGLGDMHSTSIQSVYPGLEFEATMLNGILQNNFTYIPAWSKGVNFSIIILAGLLATFLFPYLGPRLLGSLIILLLPAFILLNSWVMVEKHVILLSVLPVALLIFIALVDLVYNYLFEIRKLRHLREMFGQYVPEEHIDEMMHANQTFSLGGQNKEMTVLFADIRNFTSLSEQLTPTTLVELLNDFFSPLTEIIFQHRGTIDKYVGDMLMAFWGAPLNDKYHAKHAMISALEMQQRIKKINETWVKRNLPEIHIGIGINSGEMSVGDMGSRFRRNYTVIGDTVNLASRIEALTKQYGVSIIVSEYTQFHQPHFVFMHIDKVRVKGKEEPTDLYKLVCLRKDLTDEIKKEIKLFHKGLAYYFQQNWQEARRIMTKLKEKFPESTLYSLYLNRIIAFEEKPPPLDWDGVHTTTQPPED